MKLRERLYSLLIAIPTALFTSLQIILLLRFIAKVSQLDPQLVIVNVLYTLSGILVFPTVILLNSLEISSDGILFEVLLLPTIVIYGLCYELIRLMIAKITTQQED